METGGHQVAVLVDGSDSDFHQREQAVEQEWEQLLQQEHPRLESSACDDDEDIDREAVLMPEHRYELGPVGMGGFTQQCVPPPFLMASVTDNQSPAAGLQRVNDLLGDR